MKKVKSAPKLLKHKKLSHRKMSFDFQSEGFVKRHWLKIAIALTIIFSLLNILYNFRRNGYNIMTTTSISPSVYERLSIEDKIKYNYQKDFEGKEAYVKVSSDFSLFYMLFSVLVSFIISLVVFLIIMYLIARFM